MSTSRVGTVVTHRRYVPYSHAHYAGNLVDGAYSLGLFGDVATEMCIVLDGDEGLFASYSDVQFTAPVRAGDLLEITATLVREGTRSRVMDFAVRVVGRGAPTRRRARCRGGPRPAGRGHHRDRHGRRTPVPGRHRGLSPGVSSDDTPMGALLTIRIFGAGTPR